MPLQRLLQTTGFPLVPRNLSVQPKIAYDPIMLPFSQSARILIAEDDESLRGLLVRYLSSLGHTAEALPDGVAAVERLGQSAFDVVITDMIMPGADGLAVMRAAKIADPYSEIIFLTGMPDLASAVKALREGDAFDYIVKPFPNVEVLRATIDRALERRHLRLENARLTRELELQRSTDSLTGALNRRAFFESGEREVARSIRHREPMALVMLDVDHFKEINSVFGHAAGDAVIALLAQICRQELRAEDLLSRYAADIFVCLLPSTVQEDAAGVADRIRRAIAAQPPEIGGQSVTVRVSAGVTARQDADRSLDTLIRRGERALKLAKEEGGDKVTTV